MNAIQVFRTLAESRDKMGFFQQEGESPRGGQGEQNFNSSSGHSHGDSSETRGKATSLEKGLAQERRKRQPAGRDYGSSFRQEEGDMLVMRDAGRDDHRKRRSLSPEPRAGFFTVGTGLVRSRSTNSVISTAFGGGSWVVGARAVKLVIRSEDMSCKIFHFHCRGKHWRQTPTAES